MAFNGENILGTVVVRGSDYKMNGKWSHTTFRLELAPNVRAINGRDGWETGKFVEGLRSAVSFGKAIDTWADVANALGVSVPSAMTFLKAWRPKAAAALDEVDAQLSALDEAADKAEAQADTETVVISFGAPTRRQRSEGFWESPKGIPGHGGQVELIDVNNGWAKENVKVTGMVGTVISATHSSGHGGGYVSVTVAVVPGTSVPIPEQTVSLTVPEPQPEPEPIVAPPAPPAPPTAPSKALTAEELKAQLGGFSFGRRK